MQIARIVVSVDRFSFGRARFVSKVSRTTFAGHRLLAITPVPMASQNFPAKSGSFSSIKWYNAALVPLL